MVAISVSYAQRETAVVQHFDGDVIIVHARCFWVDAGEGSAKPVIAKVVLAEEGERKIRGTSCSESGEKNGRGNDKGRRGGGKRRTKPPRNIPFVRTRSIWMKQNSPFSATGIGVSNGRRDVIFYHMYSFRRETVVVVPWAKPPIDRSRTFKLFKVKTSACPT